LKTQLEELLEAGEDLISRIEDTKESLEIDVQAISTAAVEIDNSIAELSRQTDDLHRQIVGVRQETPHRHDPIALATTQAIDNLITLLTEAKTYFAQADNLAAYGTLIMFDQHADDLKAAIRLCQMAQRRAK